MKTHHFFWLLSLFLLVDLSCKNANPSITTTPPCPFDALNIYGKGSGSFSFPGAGTAWSASGSYKPSADFLNDTVNSEGAGGFVADTTVGGQLLSARACAYKHLYHAGNVTETIFVLTLTDSSGVVDTGAYRLVRKGQHPSARYATIDFILTDSTHTYALFASDSGLVRVASFDDCAHTMGGTVSGRLYDLSNPSTLIPIDTAGFHFEYVNHYFVY